MEPGYSEKRLRSAIIAAHPEKHEEKVALTGTPYTLDYELELLMTDLLALRESEKAWKRAKKNGYGGLFEITEGLCISAGVGTPVRIEDAQMYRDTYVKDGYLYKHPGKEACIVIFWTPKDGVPCYVPDPNIEKVLVICVETDPNKVTESDCIRRTVKALEIYANTLDSKNGVQRPAFPSKEEVSDLRNNYPVGTRISLTKMDDIQAPPIGTKGTVKGVDDAGNILVHWDNGSGLSLAYGADECEKIDLERENMEEKIKVGDLVFVSNPDTEYEKEFGVREHKSFFGTVTEVSEYGDETCIEVEFPQTPNGCEMTWSYDAKELSLSKELSGMTIEEISNRYGLQFFAEYL